MEQIPCTVCKEGGHKSAKCPTLYDPLKEGFYSGGGGGGGHSHDDDDEHLAILRALATKHVKLGSKTLVPL